MPERQRLETFERKPKRVHLLNGGPDGSAITKDPHQARAIIAAVKAIQGGAPLPSGYYRKGVGKTPDRLLQSLGIMHLHLGRPNTPELLYVVQYPDDVVILELSDHAHFVLQPLGVRLLRLYGRPLATLEAELDKLPPPKRPKFSIKVRKGPIPTKPADPKPSPDDKGEG